ncbi:MAG TPA: hypothetical protein VF720_03105 [Candidatus Eisenbacteria bacterium]
MIYWRLNVLSRRTLSALVALPVLVLTGCGGDDDGGVEPGLEKISYVVAGVAGESGHVGDDGPATDALLYWPIDMTVVPNGQLVIMDWNNHCARKIDADGNIHAFIGSGRLGDDRTGAMTAIDFNHPSDFKIGPDGSYYVAAFHNWAIRKIDPVTGQATTPVGKVAASGVGSVRGHEGDGGPANVASLNLPGSIDFDANGNLYITDQGNMRIRMVDPNGVITLIAGGENGYADGPALEARFNFEGEQATTGTGTRSGCIDISKDGRYLYIADTLNNRVRRLEFATGMVTTVAGTGAVGYSGDDGPALAATFNHPSDVVCTVSGDVYVSDRYNNVIRKIDPAGTITTVVGTGQAGFTPNGTPARETKLYNPLGLDFDDANNTLYIADMYNHQVLKVINP